jgi:hypothetical protein
MNENPQLLRPFTGTGAVFFPIGKPPGGTCAFATDECLRACYMADPSGFDEETRITNTEKRSIYRDVVSSPIEVVRDAFLCDLYGLQTRILAWFGSGDCLMSDVDHISRLIESMPDSVVQMGFTRNRTLWERHKDVFSLSINSKEEASDPNAMYSIPDYEKETSVMYVPAYQVRGGHCGPILCKDHDRNRSELTHYINCKTCHRLHTGCFDRRRPK